MSIVSLPRMAAGVACVLMLAASPAFAEDQDDAASDSGHKHGPGRGEGDPEARKALAAACSDKSEGDTCSVDFDEHTLNGTCDKSERTDKLFCHPEGRRPMRAAVEACKDKSEGDDCSFERRDGEGKLDGSCEKAPAGPMPRGTGDGDHDQDDHGANGDHRNAGDRDQGSRGERRERPLVCMPERAGD